MEFSVDGIDFDAIEEGKLAETGTYQMILANQEIKMNKKEDGQNMVFDFKVIDDPSAEGITLTVYRALPKAGDNEKTTKRGQSYTDFKLSLLKEFVINIGGSVEGNSFSVPDDTIVTGVIEKKLSDEGRPYNELDESTLRKSSRNALEL